MLRKLSHPYLIRAASCVHVVSDSGAGLCGCQTFGTIRHYGFDRRQGGHRACGRPSARRRSYQERYRANPKDVDAALKYAKALRAVGPAGAGSCGARTGHHRPSGQQDAARRLWPRAGRQRQLPAGVRRAWSRPQPRRSRLARSLGAGSRDSTSSAGYEEARHYYASALKIAPDEPSVLSNLGLSYVLSKDLPKAEETLRRAYGLRRRSARAGESGAGGRPAGPVRRSRKDREGRPAAGEAAANVAQLKQILSRKEKENARAEVEKLPIAAAGRVN